MTSERLQKILAKAGLGSRRDCEEIILAGRVTVDGKPAVIGCKADPSINKIQVDGKTLSTPEKLVYIMINKPRGVISDVDTFADRQSARDLIPIPGKLFPVGRLDLDSEGLMLFTNDGELANKLTHPRYEHENEYRVLVARRPDEKQLEVWRRGVILEDGFRTAPTKVLVESTMGKGAWLRIYLHEGHKRQIREVGKTIGLPVVRIQRVRIGSLTLGNLKPRQWRHLSPEEVSQLKKAK